LVLSGPTSLLVLEPAPPHASALIGDVWAAVVASRSLSEVADVMVARGFDAMPSLAAFFWTREGMRSVVRGEITVLDCGSGGRIADGEGVQNWNEVGLGEVTAVEIVLPDEPPGPSLQLPLVVGAVQASTLILDLAEEARLHSPQGRPESPGRPESVEPTHIVGSREEVTEAMFPSAEFPSAEFPSADADTEPWPPPTPLPGAVEAVPDREAEPEAEADIAGEGLGSTQPLPGSTAPSEETDPSADAPTALIPSVSGGGGAGPSAVVMGRLCPQGHSNPPSASTCRICAEPVAAQPPRPLSRPTLARLRASDGSVVPLDRPVLIGRAPTENAAPGVLPRLLTVPSPHHDISRTHLLVVPDGWDLMVTDLHSTNGTIIVRPPQGQRELLRPDLPTPVPIGTRLELGDGVSVTVEPPG